MKTLTLIPVLLGWLISIASAIPTADSTNHGLSMKTGVTPGSLVLEWWGIDQHVYFIEHSEDLMNWSFLPIYELGSDGPLSWGLSMTGDRQFFRVRFSDDPQSDLLSTDYNGARVSAWDQIQLGYNPFLWVDPGDNDLHDAWEEHYFGSTGVDPSSPASGEGLSFADAFALGGDPTVDESADASLREDFTYDDRGWLLSADVPSGSTIQFSHDEEGNIIQAQ